MLIDLWLRRCPPAPCCVAGPAPARGARYVAWRDSDGWWWVDTDGYETIAGPFAWEWAALGCALAWDMTPITVVKDGWAWGDYV